MALTQAWMRWRDDKVEETGFAAAEKALELDPQLPEPYCVRAGQYVREGKLEQANAEIATALRLDPDSWEANKEAAFVRYRQGHLREALALFEKAASLMDTDCRSAGMMLSCAAGLGETEAARKAAEMVVERAERLLSQDRSNGGALAWGANGLAYLGNVERAKDWMRRAILVDPTNLIMRFNLGCTAARDLKDTNTALDLIEPFMAQATAYQIRHCEYDPDLDSLRGDPRFKKMMADAKARLGIGSAEAATPAAAT